MNYYQTIKKEKQRAALIHNIKVGCWCVAVIVLLGMIGADEFNTLLAIGYLPH